MYGNILVGLSFLSLTFLTVKTFAPDIKSNAETQNISETVGPYTMSMSNDTVASINITPTASQTVYTGTNNLTVKNTCPDGATITLTTNSTTSNSLVPVSYTHLDVYKRQEQFPVRLLMLNDRGYDLIGLREVVIHMDVLKAFRHSTPSISFFLGELIYVI